LRSGHPQRYVPYPRPVSPVAKYSLARLGLFLGAAAVMVAVPLPISLLLKLAIALLISAVLSWFLLRRLRDDVAHHLAAAAQKRTHRKEQLRAALAGEDDEPAAGTGRD
jgi:hypothetical protein